MIVGTRPLAGWEIVMSGMRNFLGRPSPDNELSPVYELRTIVDPRTGITRQVLPVLFYPIEELVIHSVTARIRTNDLPIQEVEILHAAVLDCNQALVKLKSSQTGLVEPTAAERSRILA